MILVSRKACAEVARRPEPKPLRLDVQDGDLHLEPAERRTTDLSFSHEGQVVLLIDGQTAVELDGHELVVDGGDAAQDARLRLRPRDAGPPADAGEPT
jgi:hypothetical protein